MRFADDPCVGEPLTTKLMLTTMNQNSGDGEEESFSYDQDMNKTPHFNGRLTLSRLAKRLLFNINTRLDLR